MSGLIVYVDWENAWLEHVQTKYPGLHLKWTGAPALPAATTITPEILTHLTSFPLLFLSCIEADFQKKPLFCSAAALWDDLALSNMAGFPSALKNEGFEIHKPVCPATHSTPKERENFCDVYLIIQMLNDWFIHDAATNSNTKSGRFNDSTVSDIVIVSGDNVFCQAAEFFHAHSKARITFYTWSTCISKHMIALAKSRRNVYYKYIDRSAIYQADTATANQLDALRRYKAKNRPKYFDILISTAVCRLNDDRHRAVPVSKFKDWMRHWIHFWNTQKISFPHSAGSLERQFNYLKQRGIILNEKIGDINAVKLDKKSKIVKSSIEMLKTNQYGYHFLFDVPPVYHRAPDRRGR
jgi:hypothetical protein